MNTRQKKHRTDTSGVNKNITNIPSRYCLQTNTSGRRLTYVTRVKNNVRVASTHGVRIDCDGIH